MTNPAAFEATYSDFKLVRTRQCVQIILEVPLENSSKVLDVLGGMPNPAAETWVAVARLEKPFPKHTADGVWVGAKEFHEYPALAESPPPPEKGEASHPTDAPGAAPPPRRFTSLPLPQQAALLCQDARFRAFVADYCRTGLMPEDEIAGWLRVQASVVSRRDLNPDTDGGRWFMRLRDRYLAERAAA